MTEKIITYLNLKLAQLNYISKMYELCEKKKDGAGHEEPKQYCTNGEFKAIDLDFSNGTSYWRKLSPTAFGEDASSQTTSCEFPVQVTNKIRLVCFIPKGKLSADDAYSADRVGMTVAKQLTTKTAQLKNYLKAKRVTVIVDQYNTNSREVINEEYTDIKKQDINFENVYMSIDLTVTAIVSKDCIETECDTSSLEIELPVTVSFCEAIGGCELIQAMQAEIDALETSNHPALTLGASQNGLTLNVGLQILQLGLASAIASGALSSADWNTFNSKIGGTLTPDFIPVATGAGTLGDSYFSQTATNVRIASGKLISDVTDASVIDLQATAIDLYTGASSLHLDANDAYLGGTNGYMGITDNLFVGNYVRLGSTLLDLNHTVAVSVNAPTTNIGVGATVVNIGTGAGAKVINLGNTLDTINITAVVEYQLVDNVRVKDKLATYNYGGGAATGFDVGFEIEENALITGYLKTNGARTGWLFKAPATFEAELLLSSLTANRSYILPNAGGTFAVSASGNIALSALGDITFTGVLPSANGGTGVNNAGTITNASNTTITGGGTLDLGGFTLTVPATGTAVLGTAATGRVAYWTGTNTVSSDSNFLWDSTNDRLTIGSAQPATNVSAINVVGSNGLNIIQATTSSYTALFLTESGAQYGGLQRLNSAFVGNYTGTSVAMATTVNFFTVSNSQPFVTSGSILYGFAGSTSTNLGYKQDTTSFRVAPLSLLHVVSPDIWSLAGSNAFFNLQSPTGSNHNARIQVIADGSGSATYQFGNATIRRGGFSGLDGSILAVFTNTTNSGTVLTEASRWLASGVFQFNIGVANNGGGFKHSRVSTGSVGAGSTALVTITWGTAFADTNYTVGVDVQDSTTSSLSLSVVHIESKTAAAITVRVINNSVGSLTGTLHAVAVHD
jgi:hypothetical protein